MKFRWIIIISLILFSCVPIGVLEVIQIATLPQQLETQMIDESKKGVDLVIDLIQKSIIADAREVANLANNDRIREFVTLWKNGSIDNITNDEYDLMIGELVDFFNASQKVQHSTGKEDLSRILEVGVDLVENMSLEQSIFVTDDISRIATITYDEQNDETRIYKKYKPIPSPIDYIPYCNIKVAMTQGKNQFTSSITKWINLTNNQEILDEDQRPIPVNIHSRIIQADNGTFLGVVYAIISAEKLIDTMKVLDDPDMPAVLVDRSGNMLYHADESQIWSKISGYYETILYAGVDQTQVDLDGFQGEITIIRQVILDFEKAETLIIARIIPRSYILSGYEKAVIQAVLIIVISVILASILAFFVTQSLTKRLIQITEAANQLSRGNFDVKIDTTGSNELAELAKAFTRMSKSLKILLRQVELDED